MKSSDSAQGKICLNRLEKGGMALAGTFGQKHGGTAPSAERFNAASALRVQRIAENALRWPDTLQPNTKFEAPCRGCVAYAIAGSPR